MPDLLIVNADDFGITERTCSAVLRAGEYGVVTSTSVLAVGPAFVRASSALQSSGLGVGAHLAAVGEDPPLLSRREIPTLLTRKGEFRRSWREFSLALAMGQIDLDELRLEFRAQLAAVRQERLVVDHLDTHQHIHLVPAVAGVLVELSATHDIPSIRTPMPSRPTGFGTAARALGTRLRRGLRTAGVTTTDAFLAVDRRADPSAQLESCAPQRGTDSGSCELMVHLGLANDPEIHRYSWGEERYRHFGDICSTRFLDAVRRNGFELGTFGDLASSGRGTRRPCGGEGLSTVGRVTDV